MSESDSAKDAQGASMLGSEEFEPDPWFTVVLTIFLVVCAAIAFVALIYPSALQQ